MPSFGAISSLPISALPTSTVVAQVAPFVPGAIKPPKFIYAAKTAYFGNIAQDFTTVVETNVNVVTRGFVQPIPLAAAFNTYRDNTAQDTTTQSETNVHLISRGFAPTITPRAASK